MTHLPDTVLTKYILQSIQAWEEAIFGIPASENKTTIKVVNTSPKKVVMLLSITDGIFGHTRRFKINHRDHTVITTINDIDSDDIQYLNHPAIQLRDEEPVNIIKLTIPAIALKDKKKCEQLKNELITIVSIWAINDVIRYGGITSEKDFTIAPINTVSHSTRIADAIQSCFYPAQSFASVKFRKYDEFSKNKRIGAITFYGTTSSTTSDQYELWFNTELQNPSEDYEADMTSSEFVTHVKKIPTGSCNQFIPFMDTMMVMTAMLLKFRIHNWVFELKK